MKPPPCHRETPGNGIEDMAGKTAFDGDVEFLHYMREIFSWGVAYEFLRWCEAQPDPHEVANMLADEWSSGRG